MKSLQTLFLFLCLILASCKVDIDRNILFIGDSLIEQGFPQISKELLMADDHGYFLMTNAIFGTTFSHPDSGFTYNVVRAPQILAHHQADIVLISFGTNDVYQNSIGNVISHADMRTAAGAIMDAYAGRPIVWILPHDRVREIFGNTLYNDVVTAITEAAATRSNVELVDFTAYVISQGKTMNDICIPGDVHFTPPGNQLFAQLIHARLSAH
jgi:lysophospholipase L1-like esterase